MIVWPRMQNKRRVRPLSSIPCKIGHKDVSEMRQVSEGQRDAERGAPKVLQQR